MCCRVFPIPEAGKTNTDWCQHLEPGKGCRIYAQRPEPCRKFFCGWRRDANLPEAWRPDVAGFVLSDPEPWAFLVTNDPDHPTAWRREPYCGEIRAWARAAAQRAQFAGVRENEKLLLLDGLSEMEIPGE